MSLNDCQLLENFYFLEKWMTKPFKNKPSSTRTTLCLLHVGEQFKELYCDENLTDQLISTGQEINTEFQQCRGILG